MVILVVSLEDMMVWVGSVEMEVEEVGCKAAAVVVVEEDCMEVVEEGMVMGVVVVEKSIDKLLY